jgi:hypothetical protein
MASLRLFRIDSLSYSLVASLGSGLRLRLYFLFRFPMVIVVAYWILQHTVLVVCCEHIVCSRLHSEYCEILLPNTCMLNLGCWVLSAGVEYTMLLV